MAARRAGRYELLFELARGGMGAVWVGRLVGAHGFDRLVAVKELLDTEEDPRSKESFLDEARVAAKIDHPNVLAPIELFEDGGKPYIAMELVRGVSLWRLLAALARAEEPPDCDLSAWIVMQAASGLHAAHELRGPDGRALGLVHRDVSPQNVLLGFEGRVCVADFGIAKLRKISSLKTDSGFVKGKFAYMSPEQARGRPLDRRSDVFSLGIVLHEALTGRRLFDCDSPGETALEICEEPASDPRSVRADVPEAYATIALRCLAKAPADRYESADAVARALRAALRARNASADETELRALLARVVGGERDALERRIASVADGSPALASAPVLEDGAFAATTTTVDPAPPEMTPRDDAPAAAPPPTPTPSAVPISRTPTVLGVLAAVAALGGAAGIAWSKLGPHPIVPPQMGAPTSATQDPTASPPPPTVSAPSAEPPPATTPSATAPTRPPKPNRGKPPTPPAPPPPAPAPAPPSATPSSPKGTPFRNPF